MTKRAKKPLIIVLGLLLLAGGGIFYLISNLDALVASQIEKHGSAATQTRVRVSGVNIGLRDAQASLSGLDVANPEGYDGGSAIELGDFTVAIDPQSLTQDTIVLKSVTVSGARLNLLQRGAASNLKQLLDNLGGGSKAGDSDSGEPGKRLRIDRFVLEDAAVRVSVPDLDEDRTVTIPRIVLTDIGQASGGATAAEVTRQLLTPIVQRSLQSAAAQSLKDRAESEIDKAKDELLRGVMDRLGGNDSADAPAEDQQPEG